MEKTEYINELFRTIYENLSGYIDSLEKEGKHPDTYEEVTAALNIAKNQLKIE